MRIGYECLTCSRSRSSSSSISPETYGKVNSRKMVIMRRVALFGKLHYDTGIHTHIPLHVCADFGCEMQCNIDAAGKHRCNILIKRQTQTHIYAHKQTVRYSHAAPLGSCWESRPLGALPFAVSSCRARVCRKSTATV